MTVGCKKRIYEGKGEKLTYPTPSKTIIWDGSWSGSSKKPRQNSAREFVNMTTAHTETNSHLLRCAVQDCILLARLGDGNLYMFCKRTLTEGGCAHAHSLAQRKSTPPVSLFSLWLLFLRPT